MKNTIYFFICCCLYAGHGLAQVKGAEIKINNFVIDRNEYRLSCNIHFMNNVVNISADHYLVFFIKQGPNPLRQITVNDKNRQQNSLSLAVQADNININLLPKEFFSEQNFVVYSILLEGNVHSLDGSLQVISGEFRNSLNDINSVLNLLNKFGHKPLTYAETRK